MPTIDKKRQPVCGLTVVVRQHFTDSFSQLLLSGTTIKKICVCELSTHSNSEAAHFWISFVLSWILW